MYSSSVGITITGTSDLSEEIKRSKPTTLEWFSSAKNVVEYANENGIYDELALYMKETLGKKSKKMGFV